jgi:hypothetical protein
MKGKSWKIPKLKGSEKNTANEKNGSECKERNGNEWISIEMIGNDEKWTEWSEMILKEWIWKETMGNDG